MKIDKIVDIAITDIFPERNDVLAMHGISGVEALSSESLAQFNNSLGILKGLARPRAKILTTESNTAISIFEGEGQNDDLSPIADIFINAQYLAIIAATIGGDVSRKIGEQLNDGEFLMAAFLDAAASVMTDNCATYLESKMCGYLTDDGLIGPDAIALNYSPGYCGWHISAQKKLFEVLQPGDIDIRLHESCLMEPLKSITGIIAVGPRELHLFDNSYPFCKQCMSQSCQFRTDKLLK